MPPHPGRHAEVMSAGREGFRHGLVAYRATGVTADMVVARLLASPLWVLERTRRPLRARVYELGVRNGMEAAERFQRGYETWEAA